MVVVEDGDREFVAAQVFPDVFDGIEFGRIGRQRNQRDVVRHGEAFGDVITCAVEDEGGFKSCRVIDTAAPIDDPPLLGEPMESDF